MATKESPPPCLSGRSRSAAKTDGEADEKSEANFVGWGAGGETFPPPEALRASPQGGGNSVIECARAWIGTPYVHQASLKGIGCDCLGLLRGLWREIYGNEPQTVPPYLPDWDTPGGESLRDGLARHLDPVPLTGIAPGDVLVFRMVARGPARHCGLLAVRDGRLTLIHARQNKRVSEEPFTTFWRGKLAYAFRLTPQPGYDRVSGGV